MIEAKPSGSWWAALDPRRLASAHLALAAANFLLGSTLALALVLDQLNEGGRAMAPDLFARLMTLHGVIMVFLCVLPALPGVFGNLVLPRVLGAEALELPKLNRFAFQLHLLASILAWIAVLSGGVGGGWTLTPPLAAESGAAAAVLGLALHLVALGLVAQAFVIAVTIVRHRPEGDLMRLPVLAWSFFAWSVVQIPVAVVLGSVALMLMGDQLSGASLLGVVGGAGPLAFGRWFWFCAHAEIQLALLPCIGLISRILGDECRKPIHGKIALVWALILFALIAPASWGIHLSAGELDAPASAAASALALLAFVPLSMIVYCWLGTLNEGALRLRVPLLLAAAAMVHLAVGAFGGLFLAGLSTNPLLGGTRFASAQLHYLLLGVWGAAGLAALHHWWPSLGRRYHGRTALWGAALFTLGFNLAFLPEFVLGAKGVPATARYLPEGLAAPQRLAGVGAAILCLGLLVLAANLLRSWIARPALPVEGVRETR